MRPDIPENPLKQAAFDAVEVASRVAALMVQYLATADIAVVEKMADATASGQRLLLAIDIDTVDPQVRLVQVDADQVLTQLAAVGLFPPSNRSH
jgi:hypothetical protein